MTTPERELERLRRALIESPATAAGPACPSPETIWKAVSGGLDRVNTSALIDHSLSCAACAQTWMLAREFAAEAPADEALVVPFRPRPPWLSRRALAAAAGIVIAVAAAALMSYRAGFLGGRAAPASSPVELSPWRDLAIEPAPFLAPGTGATRGGTMPPPSSPTAAALRTAMEPYLAGEYDEAVERLSAFVATYPGPDEARFFLGVSLLLADRTGEAAEQLAAVVAADGATPVAEHRWYLALALLKSGRQDAALRELDGLLPLGGPYAGRAAELRAQVRALSAAGR